MDVNENVTMTLRAQEHGHQPVVCYVLEGNVVDRANGQNGRGWCEDVSPTLNTQDKHAVVYAIEGNGCRPSHLGGGYSDSGQSYTLNATEQHAVCYALDCRNGEINEEISGTLQAHNNGGWSYNCTNPVMYEKDVLHD